MKIEKYKGQADHYQDVTNKIIECLERGVRPWSKPWDDDKALPFWPCNAATGRKYRGINILLLMSNDNALNGDPRWCSYKQAKEKGWQVRQGEKGTRIYFFKPIEVRNERNEQGLPNEQQTKKKTVPILRAYTVFHASQLDGIPPNEHQQDQPEFDPVHEAEVILLNAKVIICIGGDKAFYHPPTDHIQMPPRQAFNTASGYYATALHELAHWTGGKEDRVPRNLKGRFGSAAYAREELRAEMGSAFVCTEIGIPHDIEDNASYIDSWLKVLKEDKHEIFRAASDAQKIADYCLQFSTAPKP